MHTSNSGWDLPLQPQQGSQRKPGEQHVPLAVILQVAPANFRLPDAWIGFAKHQSYWHAQPKEQFAQVVPRLTASF
jgi:hypothetical protein